MLTVFVSGALAAIIAYALFQLNRMDSYTCAVIRATFILIAIGGFAGICELFDGRRPLFSDAVLIAGLVLYFLTDRRTRQ